MPKVVAWSGPLPVARVKEIGRALGGSINDVLVSATAGGMRRYLARRAAVPPRLNLRAVMPVNLRPPATAGKDPGLSPAARRDALLRMYGLRPEAITN